MASWVVVLAILATMISLGQCLFWKTSRGAVALGGRSLGLSSWAAGGRHGGRGGRARAADSFRGKEEDDGWRPNSRERGEGLYSRHSRYPRAVRGSADWARREYPASKSESPFGNYKGDHIYGISPVTMALKARRRNISELLVQEGMDVEGKKASAGAKNILTLAKEGNVPVKEVPKHDLNLIVDNKPHQGFVLRASALAFDEITELPAVESYQVVLVLDEVCDPQNLGALLRSAHFLQVDKVVVCAKNSAPLSPATSKASAGAMESMVVYSTKNLMKFLDNCKKNEWQVVGTALSDDSISLSELPLTKPTVLVLGNEGHGVRTNILNRCNLLVRIGNPPAHSDVDSLNVSVTGGILLHHLTNVKR